MTVVGNGIVRKVHATIGECVAPGFFWECISQPRLPRSVRWTNSNPLSDDLSQVSQQLRDAVYFTTCRWPAS